MNLLNKLIILILAFSLFDSDYFSLKAQTKASQALQAVSKKKPGKASPKGSKKAKEPEEEDPNADKTGFVIEIVSPDPDKRWIARATEQNFYGNLESFPRLFPVQIKNLPLKKCEAFLNSSFFDLFGRSSFQACRIELFKKAGTKVYFLGRLESQSISYKIMDLDRDLTINSGSISVNQSETVLDIRVRLYKALKRITMKGGLLDRIESDRKKEKEKIEHEQKLKDLENASILSLAQKDREKGKSEKDLAIKEKGNAQGAKKGKSAKKEKKKPNLAKGSKKDAKKGSNKGKGKGKGKGKPGSKTEETATTLPEPEEEEEEKEPEPSWFSVLMDQIHIYVNKNRSNLKIIILVLFLCWTIVPIGFFSIRNSILPHATQRSKSLIVVFLMFLIITAILFFHIGFADQYVESNSQISLSQISRIAADAQNQLIWVVPILGGLLFGILMLLFFRSTVPVIHGFERLEHRMITLVLRAWGWLTLVRFILVIPLIILYFIASYFMGLVFQIPGHFYYAVFLPTAGLFFWFWIAYVFESLAKVLDGRLVYGPANASNPWHICIKKYLIQYFRKAGLENSPDFINKVLFLPHKEDAIDTYGGGFSRPRIVISRKIMKLALNIPEEAPQKAIGKKKVPVRFSEEISDRSNVYKPETTLEKDDPEEAQDDDAIVSASKNKKIKTDFMKLEDFQKIRTFRDYEVEGEGSGFVSHNPDKEEDQDSNEEELARADEDDTKDEDGDHDVDDFEIDPEDEKVYRVKDGVDANFTIEIDSKIGDYKDFFFGLLLTCLGQTLKKGQNIDTLYLLFAQLFKSAPQFIKRKSDVAGEKYQQQFSHFSFLMSDSIAHIYGGEPHLIQYLYFMESGNEAVLTRNGSTSEINQSNRDILREIEKWLPKTKKKEKEIPGEASKEDDKNKDEDENIIEGNDAQKVGEIDREEAEKAAEMEKKIELSMLKKRLLWLKGYFYSFSEREKEQNKANYLIKVFLPIFVSCVMAFKAIESMHYFFVYNHRIEKLQEEIDKKKEEEKKKAESQKRPYEFK